jgi:hypothetical protein
VIPGHPQGAQIETLLARDPELSAAFQELVQQFRQLHQAALTSSAPGSEKAMPFHFGTWKQTPGPAAGSSVEFTIGRDLVTVSISG